MVHHFDDELIALDFTDIETLPPLTRRRFLKLFAGGIAILMVGTDFLPAEARERGHGIPDDFNAFLLIGEDGRVTLFTGKIEMGQGAITSLPMMLADELEVPLDSVDIVMGDTDRCPWDVGTFGSLTIRQFGPLLRRAAAQARQVLLELAAEKLSVPVAGLTAASGAVSGGNKRVSYAELARGKRIARRLKRDAPLKPASDFKVMGKPRLHDDARLKVTGAAKYAADLRRPGMLYAAVLRPPAHGARRLSLDTAAARAMTGVVIVQEDDLVAVLHEHPVVAARGLAALKVEWEVPSSEVTETNIHAHLLSQKVRGEAVDGAGDPEAGDKQAAKRLRASYRDGYVAHAAMETHAALAEFVDGRLILHASTQTPFRLKGQAAQALGMSEDDVLVKPPFVGGGFGGKSFGLQALEAAQLARATGKPVQVMWSRAEEFFNDTFRPASQVNLSAGLDDDGKLLFWDYGVHYAGQRGARQFYAIPHHRTTAYGEGWRAGEDAHFFRVGAWRAPANNSNTFARESAIDELALLAGTDPLAFRLANLKDKKMIAVLEGAAKKFNWKPSAGGKGRGQGLACGIDAETYVAVMVEVEVDAKTGHVQVLRAVVCQDMGLCVNPQGAVIQAEGCVMMGLGYALSEELRFAGGKIHDTNFDTYQLPLMSWTPKQIDVVILPRQDDPPAGGGEPAIICMGGAVANAVAHAVNARVRHTPITPKRVLTAIAEATSADQPAA